MTEEKKESEKRKQERGRKEKSIRHFFGGNFLFTKDRWHWLRAMGSSITLTTVMIVVMMRTRIKICPVARKLPSGPIHFE